MFQLCADLCFPFHSLSHKTILAFCPLQTSDTITTLVWEENTPKRSWHLWVYGRPQVRAGGKLLSFLPSSDLFFFFPATWRQNEGLTCNVVYRSPGGRSAFSGGKLQRCRLRYTLCGLIPVYCTPSVCFRTIRTALRDNYKRLFYWQSLCERMQEDNG